MKRSSADIRGFIDDIAHRKARAARMRRHGRPPGQESSRATYLQACSDLASPLSSLGFSYATSKQQATLRTDPFVFYVSFQSSHHNVPGEYVSLSIFAGVWSPPLKKWRVKQAHALPRADLLAGGQVGNLLGRKTWYEWNLAVAEQRAEALSEAAEVITGVALPYFRQFQDTKALLAHLLHSDIPELSVGNAVELCLFLDSRQHAVAVAQRFLDSRPDLATSFLANMSAFRSGGLPRHLPSGWAQELAWVVFAYDLPVEHGGV